MSASSLSSRERVKAAIAHRETSRPPYCIALTPGGADRLRKATCGKSPLETLDNDVIQVFPPWWSWRDTPADWRKPDAPSSAFSAPVSGTGSYPAFFEQVRMLRDHTDKYILAMVYGSHFEKAYFARGLENFLADLGGEPDFSRAFLGRIIDRNMVMLENFLSAPEIDGVLLGSDWGTQRDLIMSPPVWEDLIRPGEQREYDLIHAAGKDVWVHSCGNIEKIMSSLVEMGVDVINPVQPECMDLATLKSRFGARIAFWGGISTQKTLPYGTPDEVRREARQVRALMGAGGGFVFAPAQELQEDVPPENILALLEVAREET
jgi:uroporphyrinogen decarboxylase